ncbi:galactose-1-epimerase [Vibrio sp. WXL103]|uniref:galactose-1-epimerase n=1 Tax=Vibrio sp. WXL103 TaxID=3450710 RepID=UPI003EC7A7FB
MSEVISVNDQLNGLELLEQAMTQSVYRDGRAAKVVHLRNSNGVTASFMDIGATWLSFCAPVGGQNRELLIRPKHIEAFAQHGAYMGATVGRFANRIANGKFSIDGKRYQLPVNNGLNSLHGGDAGFDQRRWEITEFNTSRVVFELASADGDQGYPGNLMVKVVYQLSESNELTIDYYASCDQACPINLTNHAYFNLSAENADGSALEHQLQILSDHYLPTDQTAIPTGELRSVAETSFDFRVAKSIGRDFLQDSDQKLAGGYDHCFVFEPEVCDSVSVLAKLVAPENDVTLLVKSTKPGMQCYTGNFLNGIEGFDKQYAKYDGVALETQYFPDAPNNPEWQDRCPMLRPEETYRHRTAYQIMF